MAIDFKLPDLNGELKTLESFRGRTILLNFWATWCIPCVAEMDSLERLYKTHKDKKFEIVAINVDPDENLESVKKFIKDKGLTFTVLRDSELSLPPKYGLTGFPESFFISPESTHLLFTDPSSGEKLSKIVGDRPWDAPAFIDSVAELLKGK